ncbi:MAG: autotransporter domain-containing protein [Thermodesulfobacteriota bacterium]|nr:autotransporter domain-containing protein [Thermodesulfobacteriota bacterium]
MGQRTGFSTILMMACLCLLFSWKMASAGDGGDIVPRHAFAIGVGVSHFDNEEKAEDAERGGPEWDGWMYGVAGHYTYHNDIMIHTSLHVSAGDLDYRGGTTRLFPGGQTVQEPAEKDADSNTVECRGLLGYDFPFRERHLITPFLGIGYRYWREDRGGVGGYEREVAYWYCPIGLRTYSPLSDAWIWGMKAEYDLFLDGEVDSDISRMPSFHYDSGYGMRFSLCFRRELTKHMALLLEPYVTYWDMDESDVELFALPGGSDGEPYTVFPFIEPDNHTTTCGLWISLEF